MTEMATDNPPAGAKQISHVGSNDMRWRGVKEPAARKAAKKLFTPCNSLTKEFDHCIVAGKESGLYCNIFLKDSKTTHSVVSSFVCKISIVSTSDQR